MLAPAGDALVPFVEGILQKGVCCRRSNPLAAFALTLMRLTLTCAARGTRIPDMERFSVYARQYAVERLQARKAAEAAS